MASLGGYSEPVCGDRQPEVNGWVQSLGYSAERLIALANELEKRLAPVLGPCPPTNTCGEKQSEAGCPLALSVQQCVTTLNAAEDRINSVLRRLEI